MLSICIPVYNYDIRNLVDVLAQQANQIPNNIEILVFDDQSEQSFQSLNRDIKKHSIVTYTVLDKNIGYSKIRNLFTKNAKYDYLLYLDADTIPVKESFIKDYVNAIQPNTLIYGGLDYLDTKPDIKHLLRWKYGHAREVIPIETRKQNPYKIFISMSFLIPKKLLLQFPFNEKLTQYGHEDTLLAYNLMSHEIPFIHIDNPVYHLNLDSNKKFLRKIELAVESLLFVRNEIGPNFNQMVRLLEFACTIQKNKLSSIVNFLFFFAKPILKLNLLSPFPFMYFIDFYKLGYLIKIGSKSKICG